MAERPRRVHRVRTTWAHAPHVRTRHFLTADGAREYAARVTAEPDSPAWKAAGYGKLGPFDNLPERALGAIVETSEPVVFPAPGPDLAELEALITQVLCQRLPRGDWGTACQVVAETLIPMITEKYHQE